MRSISAIRRAPAGFSSTASTTRASGRVGLERSAHGPTVDCDDCLVARRSIGQRDSDRHGSGSTAGSRSALDCNCHDGALRRRRRSRDSISTSGRPHMSVEHRLLQAALAERRRRVVHRVGRRVRRACRRIRGRTVPCARADARAGLECLQRVTAERHDHRRIEHLELALQIWRAGGNLVRLGVAVAGRPALDDVGDENLLAPPADLAQQLVEQVAGRTDERAALLVLVVAGSLADEDDLGLGMALPGHGQGAALVQRAQRADRHLGSYLRRARGDARPASRCVSIHSCPAPPSLNMVKTGRSIFRWARPPMIPTQRALRRTASEARNTPQQPSISIDRAPIVIEPVIDRENER